MTGVMDLTIENKLSTGERDIDVFHHATRSAYLISHNSNVTLNLGNSGDNDYLHISVVRGPGYVWMDCVISMPDWADFEFLSEGKVAVRHSPDNKKLLLKIPPGPPTWELKITSPNGWRPTTTTNIATNNHIIIHEEAGESGRKK